MGLIAVLLLALTAGCGQPSELAKTFDGPKGRTVDLIQVASKISLIYWTAWNVQPDHTPGGNWALAARLYNRASQLWGEYSFTMSTDAERGALLASLPSQSDIIYGAGYCSDPRHNSEGSWSEAAKCYEMSAMVANRSEDRVRGYTAAGSCFDPRINSTDTANDMRAHAFYTSAGRL